MCVIAHYIIPIWSDVHICVISCVQILCVCFRNINLCKRGTVELSIFLVSHMHKLWTIAVRIFVGRSDSEWAILVAPWAASAVSAITLPLRAAFHLRPFTETFQTEKENDGKREIKGERKCRGKEKGSASAAPSSRLQSWLWISMLLMKSADVERMYSGVYACAYCGCSLCNLCYILTSVSLINIIIEA